MRASTSSQLSSSSSHCENGSFSLPTMASLEQTAILSQEMFAKLWSNVKYPSSMHCFKTGSSMVLNVKYKDMFERRSYTGTLYITSPTVFFIDSTGTKEIWICTSLLQQLDRGNITTHGAPLTVRCKDFRVLHFLIHTDKDRQAIINSLGNLMQQAISLATLPCFVYRPASAAVSQEIGWDFLDLRAEYTRMGVPNAHWLYTSLNVNYALCDTYPPHLYVASANTKILNGSAAFRSRGRLPVLTYLHKNGKSALCRCSQPLAGLRAQCKEDQECIADILAANVGSQTLYIVDTRPKVNAVTNRVQGKGWENDKYYKNIICNFFPIQNIHVMRNSLEKLVKACTDADIPLRYYLAEVDSSGWLSHVKVVLETAKFIADTLQAGSSVLVHCSDGWDRTSQTCALAELLLDPHYRTCVGFQTLIDKDWLSFGHKFSERCGHLPQCDPQEVSPVFTQFLDCVYQLCYQFPKEFEFNERYLLSLHDAAHSCLYGNFIGNCVKDRVDLRVKQKSFSYWAEAASQRHEHLNPLYQPSSDVTYLVPNVAPQLLRPWIGLYNRGHDIPDGFGSARMDQFASLLHHNATLRAHQEWLQSQIQHLAGKLGRSVEEELKQMSLSETSVSLFDSFHRSISSLSDVKSPPLSPELDHPLSPMYTAGLDEDSNPPKLEGIVPTSSSSPFVEERLDPLKKIQSLLQESAATENGPSQALLMQAALNLFKVDWMPLRLAKSCHKCSRQFDCAQRKTFCNNCGHLFCRVCVRPVKRLLAVPNSALDETNEGLWGCVMCLEKHDKLCDSLLKVAS